MEGAMSAEVQQTSYPTVDFVMRAIASWINKYRHMTETHDAFGQCSPEDVSQIAKDLGVSTNELRTLAAKQPGAGDLVEKMLLSLHVDPQALASTQPAVMRDLKRLCVMCGEKSRCTHELKDGTADGHFQEFCPNAFTLDALFKMEQSPR
jgi:hypothetical protein